MTTVTAHSLAEELRAVGHIEEKASDIPEKRKRIDKYPNNDDFETVYQRISDDFLCITFFFKLNDTAITSKGVSVPDKYPLMLQFCSELFTKMGQQGDTYVKEFDNEVIKLRDLLIELKAKDENVAALMQTDLSADMGIMKAFSLSFNEICAVLGGLNFTGHTPKEGFKKMVNLMLDMLRGTPIDVSAYGEEKQKFFEMYSKIDEKVKDVIRKRFEVVLAYFAKSLLTKRCPIAISGKLHYARSFIRDLWLADIFEFLRIPVDSRLALLSC